jgi:hypothetical protein
MMALQERENVFGYPGGAWGPSPASPEFEEFFLVEIGRNLLKSLDSKK